MRKWRQAKGDYTHRLDYDLNENSIVFDVGGYEGWFADQIWNEFKCQIHIFEPVPEFYLSIEKRFEGNKKIWVHNYGLASKNKNTEIFMNGDATSVYVKKGKAIPIFLRDIKNILYGEIDLMKLNIEGGEFPLLKSVIDQELVEKIKNIQVQFHDHIPNAVEMRNKIREGLSKTHRCTYDYEFIWENWERK